MAPWRSGLPAAVIFDMDGLLLDTEPMAARAWTEAAKALGVEFDDALALSLIGRNFVDCCAMVRNRYHAGYPVDELLSTWHRTYDAIVEREGIELKPGVHEILDWLDRRSIPCSVATSTRRSRAETKLTRTSLWPRFRALVGGDEIAYGKPAPDIYVESARRLGVDATDCVALEDSEPGIRSAHAARMMPIMVPDLRPPSEELLALDLVVLPTLHDVIRHLEHVAAPKPKSPSVR